LDDEFWKVKNEGSCEFFQVLSALVFPMSGAYIKILSWIDRILVYFNYLSILSCFPKQSLTTAYSRALNS
jgi:hypothetical protein